MPVADIVVLGFIVTAFIVFSATLGWASWRERAPERRHQWAHQTHQPPINARHA